MPAKLSGGRYVYGPFTFPLHCCLERLGNDMPIAAQMTSDDRGFARFTVDLNATLRDKITRPHDVTIEDLSLTGFRLSGAPDLPVGAPISIGFAGIGTHQARIMRRDADIYGCEFITPITQDMLHMALHTPIEAPIAFPPAIGALRSDGMRATASIAEPLQLGDAPEPYVEPYAPRTKLTIAAIAAVAAWAAAIGLYLSVA